MFWRRLFKWNAFESSGNTKITLIDLRSQITARIMHMKHDRAVIFVHEPSFNTFYKSIPYAESHESISNIKRRQLRHLSIENFALCTVTQARSQHELDVADILLENMPFAMQREQTIQLKQIEYRCVNNPSWHRHSRNEAPLRSLWIRLDFQLTKFMHLCPRIKQIPFDLLLQ